MRQRLGLAAALIRRPRLLVLDEPTNGLDPQGIREIRDLLARRCNRQGTTVFLSSHLLAEVEQLCTRVGVLDRGRLVVQDRLGPCAGRPGACTSAPRTSAQARALLDGRVEQVDAHELLVRARRPRRRSTALLVQGGVRVELLAPERRTLEDVVLEATRRRLRPGGAMIRVELAQAAAQPAYLGDDRADRRAARPWSPCCSPSPTSARGPGTGPAFLSAVLTDGTLYPLAAIAIVLPLFLPAAVAVAAGDAIAGEAQPGTLRYVLVRPVGRTRLLVAKLVAVMAFVLLACSWSRRTAYVLGALLLGHGEARPDHDDVLGHSADAAPQLAVRTGLALLYAMLSMLGVASVALFLSTMVASPLAAAMGTLARADRRRPCC